MAKSKCPLWTIPGDCMKTRVRRDNQRGKSRWTLHVLWGMATQLSVVKQSTITTPIRNPTHGSTHWVFRRQYAGYLSDCWLLVLGQHNYTVHTNSNEVQSHLRNGNSNYRRASKKSDDVSSMIEVSMHKDSERKQKVAAVKRKGNKKWPQ